MVYWLGFGAFTAGAQVQSLVKELRSHKPGSTAKINKINAGEGIVELGNLVQPLWKKV